MRTSKTLASYFLKPLAKSSQAQFHWVALRLQKSLHWPFLVGLFILVALPILWKIQQDNVNPLAEQVKSLQQNLHRQQQNAIAPKDAIALEKDILALQKDLVNSQNAIYGTLVQALGGTFFFITAYLSWRNVRATEEKQVTERFSKAVEQLGSDKVEVRLGGIYALERIAKDSEKDHWTIMEVLTSFVQAKAPLSPLTINPQPLQPLYGASVLGDQVGKDWPQKEPQSMAPDIQAALTVICRRDVSKDPSDRVIDLSSTNFSGANLGEANLTGTFLSKANLRGANLVGARLNRADLSETDLSGAILSGANLSGANLDMANLSEANLIGTNLSEASLSKTDLHEAHLVGANLSEADFNRANLVRTFFSEADLTAANFCGADLTEAFLLGTNLSNANLSEANLHKANLEQANLGGADLTGAIALTQEQIQQAVIDRDTKLPKYL